MSPIESTRSLLQQRPQPQDDFQPVPGISAFPLDAETRVMSQTKSPASSSARNNLSLGTGQQQQKQQPLIHGDGSENSNGSESKKLSQLSSLPPLLSSLSSSSGMVKWITTTPTNTTTSAASSRPGTTMTGYDSQKQQQPGLEDSRWDDLEPRSIEEMIARPLQRQRRQHQRQQDNDEGSTDEGKS
jgi:hypothetical protein